MFGMGVGDTKSLSVYKITTQPRELAFNISRCFVKYSQIWANDHLRIVATLTIANTILGSHFPYVYSIEVPLNNDRQ